MWLDGLVIVLFVLSTAFGYRRGFVNTFVHMAGWLLSMVISFALYPKVSAFLMEKTDFYDSIHVKVAEKVAVQSASTTKPISEALPDILRTFWDKAEATFANALTDGLSGLVFQLITFLLVVLAIRMVFLLFSSLFSKKHNEGLIGFTDGLLGLLMGSIRGIILIYLVMALIVPVIGLSTGDFLSSSLSESSIAKSFYDNNLLLLIIKGSLL